METVIQLKRGLKENLPVTGAPGEPHFATDSGELFIGNANNEVIPVQLISENIIDKGAPDGVAELDNSGFVSHTIKTDDLLFTSYGVNTINYNQNKLLVSLPITQYRSLKFLINVADQTTGEFYTTEILAHHNGTSATFTEYAVLGVETVGFSVSILENNINLYGLSSKDNQIVRVITTAIRFS